jgi:monovalent cation:H+ antiporter-2, CPA2 family
MPVLQPFAALYVLILASASPLLAKESERIYGLFVRLFSRFGGEKKTDEEVENSQI